MSADSAKAPGTPVVTPEQQRIADAVAQSTTLFFVDWRNELALVRDIEEALPAGKDAVADALYRSGDLLNASEHAAAIIERLQSPTAE